MERCLYIFPVLGFVGAAISRPNETADGIDLRAAGCRPYKPAVNGISNRDKYRFVGTRIARPPPFPYAEPLRTTDGRPYGPKRLRLAGRETRLLQAETAQTVDIYADLRADVGIGPYGFKQRAVLKQSGFVCCGGIKGPAVCF